MADDSATTLDRIISERREKAAVLRAGGRDPYRNDVFPRLTIGDVRRVETVFKAGVGYDPQKLIDSVRGQVGLW